MALHVIAQLNSSGHSHPDVIRESLAELASKTVKEPGCIRFEISHSTDQPEVFYLVESWVDQAALDTHLAADYTRAYLDTGMTELAQHHVVAPVTKG